MNKESVKPIILLVSERSGSNLLRTLLGKHSQIEAPIAPHFLAEFYHARKYYEDLNVLSNKEKLCDDMMALANHEFNNWGIQRDEINLSNCNSFVGVFNEMYIAKARKNNKTYYCCKGIESFHYIDSLRAELLDAKFIHLVRDPRDHVASWMNKPISIFTPLDAILKWKNEQSVLIDAIETKGLNCYSLKYEDLVNDTPKYIAELINFIELPVEEACFTTDSNNTESARNTLWENLSRPIIKNNFAKYKQTLSQSDIELIESVAHKEMLYFSYEFDTKCNWLPDKDFVTTNENLTEQKKKQLDASNRPELKALESKLNLVNKLRDTRRKDWLSKHSHADKINRMLKKRHISNPFWTTRLKYLSYAILGTSITNKLLRKKS